MTDLASISDDWWHGGVDDWIENERRTTAPYEVAGSGNPFYHLRGGEQGDEEMTRRMAEYLAPHISSGIGQVVDGIQEFFKSPEQREQEKRDKEALEEAERKKKEREEGSWSSLLSPFFHLSGGAIDKYLSMAKEFAKKAGYKDWDSLRRADDGEHKLELRGVKFGRKGYGDFIKYSLDEGEEKARKHRDAYLARAKKIRGDWAKDMYSPNSLAIKVLWGGGLSGGGKTQAELEAMTTRQLVEYGKSQGVKGLDGMTKKVMVDKILKQAPEKEVVAPSSSELKAPQLAKMIMLSEGNLEKEIIPLAKKYGIERILHKNKKTLVNELVDKLVEEGEIQEGDSITKIPQLVRYLFGKDVTPYPEEESEAEEDEGSEPEVEVTEYWWDGVKYLVEEPREGLDFKDRRVFDPETYEELGTLGEQMWWGLAVDVAEDTNIGVELVLAKPDAVIQPAPEPVSAPAPKPDSSKERSKFEERLVDLLEKLKGERPGTYEHLQADEGVKTHIARENKRRLEAGEPYVDIRYETEKTKAFPFTKRVMVVDGKKLTGSGRGKPVLAPQDVLEGKKDNPVVEETIEEPMDDSDIRQYLPNAKIMRYSALAKLRDIEQLLPTDKSYVILLYENTPGSGHWIALMRYGRTIEFFCSYGSKIDAPLGWQSSSANAMLGQSKPYLSMLLHKARGRFKAIYNPVAYQSKKDGVATCGAWDVMRINQMKNHNQDLHEFHDFMESVKKETGLTYDEIVVNYVSKR